MSTPSSPMLIHRRHLNLRDRVIASAVFAAAAGIFLTVGWKIMEPVDPLGAVSVLTRGGGIVLLAKAAILAAAAAGVATAVAGRKLADIGVFAAALGLAIVSVRGQNAGFVLRDLVSSSGASVRGVAIGMAMESLGWCAVMFVAVAVSAAVMSRLFRLPAVGGAPDDAGTADAASRHPEAEASAAAAWAMAGLDVPRFSQRLVGGLTVPVVSARDGMRHALIAAGVALVVFIVLSAGFSSRAVRHGESCFLVALCVLIGSWTAHRFAPMRTALWSMAAVPIATTAGFLGSAAFVGATLTRNTPPSPFLRVLPIQFAAVGCAAAVAMLWSVQVRVRREAPEARPKQRPPAAPPRRGSRR